jgi:hypothetical protein
MSARSLRRYAKAVKQRDELAEALRKIAEVCNGYGDEAAWACKHARAALAKLTADKEPKREQQQALDL